MGAPAAMSGSRPPASTTSVNPAAAIWSAAIALRLLGRSPDIAAAETMARELWARRPKGKYGRA